MIKTTWASGDHVPTLSWTFFLGGEGRTRTNNKIEKNGKKVSQYILSK